MTSWLTQPDGFPVREVSFEFREGDFGFDTKLERIIPSTLNWNKRPSSQGFKLAQGKVPLKGLDVALNLAGQFAHRLFFPKDQNIFRFDFPDCGVERFFRGANADAKCEPLHETRSRHRQRLLMRNYHRRAREDGIANDKTRIAAVAKSCPQPFKTFLN